MASPGLGPGQAKGHNNARAWPDVRSGPGQSGQVPTRAIEPAHWQARNIVSATQSTMLDVQSVYQLTHQGTDLTVAHGAARAAQFAVAVISSEIESQVVTPSGAFEAEANAESEAKAKLKAKKRLMTSAHATTALITPQGRSHRGGQGD